MKRYIYKLKKGIYTGLGISLGIAIGFGTAALLSVSVGNINTFSSGTSLSSSKVNENFANLKTAVESVNEVPVGTIIAYGGVNPPAGWFICDGSTLSRTGYTALYAVIGINFGAGDGSTTFHLPDLRHRFLRGWDNLFTSTLDPDKMSRTSMNSGGGSTTSLGSIQDDSFQGHWHELWMVVNGGGPGGSDNTGGASTVRNDRIKTAITDGVNGIPRLSSETRPKNVYVNFIIKY